jgi:hypothetical protein
MHTCSCTGKSSGYNNPFAEYRISVHIDPENVSSRPEVSSIYMSFSQVSRRQHVTMDVINLIFAGGSDIINF